MILLQELFFEPRIYTRLRALIRFHTEGRLTLLHHSVGALVEASPRSVQTRLSPHVHTLVACGSVGKALSRGLLACCRSDGKTERRQRCPSHDSRLYRELGDDPGLGLAVAIR